MNAFNIAPRAGIVVNSWGDANAYFSYTTLFFPNLYGRLRDNAPIAPQQGHQFEAGIKQSLMNGRLLATLAAFQTWKQNVLTPDPQFRVRTGEQLSKGDELELTGRITRNWSAICNYAFTRAFVSKDNSIRVGTLLPAAPRHSGGVMSVWDFDRASLRGVSLGGGVYSASERPTSLFNPLVLPGYARVDLFVSYRRSNWKLQVNVNNVGNRNYYESTSFNLHPQPSRHVIANVSYTL